MVYQTGESAMRCLWNLSRTSQGLRTICLWYSHYPPVSWKIPPLVPWRNPSYENPPFWWGILHCHIWLPEGICGISIISPFISPLYPTYHWFDTPIIPLPEGKSMTKTYQNPTTPPPRPGLIQSTGPVAVAISHRQRKELPGVRRQGKPWGICLGALGYPSVSSNMAKKSSTWPLMAGKIIQKWWDFPRPDPSPWLWKRVLGRLWHFITPLEVQLRLLSWHHGD